MNARAGTNEVDPIGAKPCTFLHSSKFGERGIDGLANKCGTGILLLSDSHVRSWLRANTGECIVPNLTPGRVRRSPARARFYFFELEGRLPRSRSISSTGMRCVRRTRQVRRAPDLIRRRMDQWLMPRVSAASEIESARRFPKDGGGGVVIIVPTLPPSAKFKQGSN